MRPIVGGHVSAAGGFSNAIENAERIGAKAIQIFGASPQQWAARLPHPDDVKKYKERLKNSSVERVYLHAAYLPNVATPDPIILARSIKNLTDHLKIAEMLGANGLIFHVGSGKEMPKVEAVRQAFESMKKILEDAPGKAELIMENSAGGGQKLGANAAEYGVIMKHVKSPRVKVCFDTAHAFEAGMIEKYTPQNIKALFDDWDKEVGIENIVALHVNDSKTAYNSHHDRHENIGEGHIGLEGFKNLAKEKRLSHTAWLLEVPGFNDEGPDKKNVDILNSLF